MKYIAFLIAVLFSPFALADAWCDGKHTYRETEQCYQTFVGSSKRALERKIKEVVNHPAMTQEILEQLDREHTQWAYSVEAQCQDSRCVAKSIQGRIKVLDLLIKHLGGPATAPAAVKYRPSFDCTKASTVVEKLICGSEKLSDLDNALNGNYKEAISITSDNGWLKEEQIDWIKNTRNKCQDETCLVGAYEQRIDELFWTIKQLENGQ